MVKVLFFRTKVSALAKVVIGKRAAAALYGANWKSRNFFGIVLQQAGIGRGSKWWVSFAKVKKTVDLRSRALTLRVEDSSETKMKMLMVLICLDTDSTMTDEYRCGGKWQ